MLNLNTERREIVKRDAIDKLGVSVRARDSRQFRSSCKHNERTTRTRKTCE